MNTDKNWFDEHPGIGDPGAIPTPGVYTVRLDGDHRDLYDPYGVYLASLDLDTPISDGFPMEVDAIWTVLVRESYKLSVPAEEYEAKAQDHIIRRVAAYYQGLNAPPEHIGFSDPEANIHNEIQFLIDFLNFTAYI
jgi:hypothetical protein